MGDSTILRTLAKVRFRLTAAHAVETGLRAALYAAALAILTIAASDAVYSVLPAWYRDFAYPFAPLALVPSAFLAGAALRLARPVSLRDAAIYLDRQAGLLERVSTAYELIRRGDPDAGLGQLVCDEARQICTDFRPSAIRYTSRAAPLARYLVAAILICGAALFLPPYKTDAFLRAEARQSAGLAAADTLHEQISRVAVNPQTDRELAALLQQAERAAEALRNSPDAADPARAELERVKGELEKLKTKREAASKSAVGATPGSTQADNSTPSATNHAAVPGAAPDAGKTSAVTAAPGQVSPTAGSTDEAKLTKAIDTLNHILQLLPPPDPTAAGSPATGAATSASAPARSDAAPSPWAKLYSPRAAPPPSTIAANHSQGTGPTETVSSLPANNSKPERPADDSRLPDDLRDLARKYFSGDQP